MSVIAAIVLSGGRGSRMKSNIPKQYMEIYNYPIIYYSLMQLEKNKNISEITLVASKNDIEYCKNEIVKKYGFKKVKNIVAGGNERYESVYNGLKKVIESDYVYIHDGARPCLNENIINTLYKDVVCYGSAVAAVPAKDTIKLADVNGFVEDTPERNKMWIIQTPQVFKTKEIIEAYDTMMKNPDKTQITDDSMVMEKYSSNKVHLSLGEYTNIKITTPEDLELVKVLLKKYKKS